MNDRIIKYTQLYTESVLFLFLLIPTFAIVQYQYPFESYLLLTGLCILSFDVGLRLVKNYAVYIPSIIIVFCLMHYVFNYPGVMALIWIGFMTWRHVYFNRHGPSDNQVTVLVFTVFMLLIGVIVFEQSNLIWLAIFQAVMVPCAYWYRLVSKAETHNMPIKTFMTFGAFVLLLLIGGGIIYAIHPFIIGLITVAFSGIGTLFEYTVFGIAGTADILGIDISSLKSMVDDEAIKQAANRLGESMDDMNQGNDTNSGNSDSMGIINWWTISLLTVMIAFLAIYLSRKNFTANSQTEQNKRNIEAVSVVPIKSSQAESHTFLTRQSTDSPHEPIRKKVHQFEQLAYAKGFGRAPSETIEEWLYRLEFTPSHLDIYQKVRYGEKSITDEERDSIYYLLDSLISSLNEL